MKTITTNTLPALALVLSILGTQPAFGGKPGGGSTGGGSAVGVVTIDQDKALAGGVTSGDTPGFPVTISEPGSYRLEGNLTVQDTSTIVLHITANNVTIDLDGFTIAGPNVCTKGGMCNSNSGTHAIVGANNTTIFGGTVRGIGGTGISLGRNAHVERVHVQHCGLHGIALGERSLLTDSTIEANYEYGVIAGTGSLVLRNVIGLNATGAQFRTRPPLPER